ncbi:MAG: preprotein translocase subunit Sec61beta [Methanomicrobia archaeon]|nr:preprotein translocase subunit Sec61beta [Methanomicrobia archaeon]HDM22428.1 preprotein translocase subunit Sec61beta [Methanomicrobia archaeon]
MAKGKTRKEGALPPTGAGLIRYFDEETKGIKMSPYIAVGLCIATGVIVVLLHVLR